MILRGRAAVTLAVSCANVIAMAIGDGQLPICYTYGWWVRAACRMVGEDAMSEFLIYLLLLVPFGFPVVPWLVAKRWGITNMWASVGLVVLALFLMPFLFFGICAAAACGQGAILIFPLAGLWGLSVVVTIISAAIAARVLRRPAPGS
jgi:hypothetical protein